MSSFKNLKKMIPMPNHCPFCGRKLTSQNAELDHIIPVQLGGKSDIDNVRYICRECNVKKADKYSPLLEYYVKLMRSNVHENQGVEKTIDYILRYLSEDDLTALENKIEKEDGQYNKIKSKYALITEMNTPLSEEKQKISNKEQASIMESFINAYKHYDINSEDRVNINGNVFIFKKGFPIEQYRDTLVSYGEEKKDEKYFVYINEEGRLVIY